MPVVCPHCHNMVAERPNCPACGKPLINSDNPDAIDRATMFALMRYALQWTLGIVGVGVLCILGVYVMLLLFLQ